MKKSFNNKQDICKENTHTTLDFANPQHAAYFLERFGGEKLLKTKFPAVYKAFTRTKRLRKAIGNQSASDDAMKEVGFYVTAIGVESQQSNTIKNSQKMQNDDSKLLFSHACLHLENESPYIGMIGVMEDITNEDEPINLDSFAVYFDEGISQCSNVLEYPCREFLGLNDHKLRVRSESSYIKPDGTIGFETQDSATFLVKNMKQMVTDFEITAPKYKDDPQHSQDPKKNPLIFLYGRDPTSGEVADKSYSTQEIGLLDDKVNTLIPIEGSFTVADGFTPQGFSTSKSHLPMLLYNEKGVVEYGYSFTDIANCFCIDETNKQKVNFKLKDDWNARLNVTTYTAHAVTLKLQFSFYYDIYDIKLKMAWAVPFSIESLLTPPTEGYYKAASPTVGIPQISIRWGCFHKDTLITTADGSKKPIREIMEGDIVASNVGNLRMNLRVRGVVKGYEAKLFHIEAQNGLVLEVSATHPVVVKRGIVPARLLNAADILVLADKTTSAIKYIYERDYKDDAYNLDTGVSGAMLLAEGMLAGDLVAQNEFGEKKQSPVFSKEVIETAEQMRQLFEYLYKEAD